MSMMWPFIGVVLLYVLVLKLDLELVPRPIKIPRIPKVIVLGTRQISMLLESESCLNNKTIEGGPDFKNLGLFKDQTLSF